MQFYQTFRLLFSILGMIVVMEVVFVILVAPRVADEAALNFRIRCAARTALNHRCHLLRAKSCFIHLVSRVYSVSIFVGSLVSHECLKHASALIRLSGCCWSKSRMKCFASCEICFSPQNPRWYWQVRMRAMVRNRLPP